MNNFTPSEIEDIKQGLIDNLHEISRRVPCDIFNRRAAFLSELLLQFINDPSAKNRNTLEAALLCFEETYGVRE